MLGIAFGLAVLVGNTIGMGILRTPGTLAALVPSAPLFMGLWVAGACYALLGALSVSELGAANPRSGGLYPLVHDAIGPYPGFLVGWTDWLGLCGSMAAVSMVLAEYVGPLVPGLAGHQGVAAGTAVVLFAVLQWGGVKVGDITQQVTSLCKAVALTGLVIAALVLPATAPASAAPLAMPVMPTGIALVTAIVVGLQSVIFTYDGWTGPIYFSEEVKDPGREIPRAMIGGILLVLVIYLLLNLAFLHVIPIGEMAGQPFVAASVAARLFGPSGDTVLRLLTIVSLFATINALQLMASRVPFAMSRDRLLPPAIANVNRGGTPVPALVLGTLVTLVIIGTNTVDSALAKLAFFFVANYALTFVALFVDRRRRPAAARPFRVPGYPYVPGIALLGSIAFLVAAVVQDPVNSYWSLGLLALSGPAFLLVRRVMRAGPAAS